jgi:hypothetical protein
MPESIASRLYDLYDQLGDAGMRVSLQRSDFVTRLAAPLLAAIWRETHGRAPKIREPLRAPDRIVLEAILSEDFESRLCEAANACNLVMAEVNRLLAVAPATAAPVDFSESTAIWVRQRSAGTLPLATRDCEAFARHLVGEGERPARLSREGFEAAYRRTYDVTWATVGEENLRHHPPSGVLLGRDQRPPLTVNPNTVRRDWSQGTGRPVYERYRLWSIRTGRVAAPRCVGADCQCLSRPVAPDPGLTEVLRACEVYGLAELTHQQILRSVVRGLDRSVARDGWTTWEAWAEPCRPIRLDDDVDPTLADAVESAFAAWVGGPVGGPIERSLGLEGLRGPLTLVVARKAWMDLLGWERTFAHPMRRCGIPRLMRTALYRHAPRALVEWISGRIGDPEPEFPESGPSNRAAGEWAATRDATMDLLTAHPRIVKLMMDGDERWRDAYGDAVAVRQGVRHLPPGEAFDAVRRLIEGMDDR